MGEKRGRILQVVVVAHESFLYADVDTSRGGGTEFAWDYRGWGVVWKEGDG